MKTIVRTYAIAADELREDERRSVLTMHGVTGEVRDATPLLNSK